MIYFESHQRDFEAKMEYVCEFSRGALLVLKGVKLFGNIFLQNYESQKHFGVVQTPLVLPYEKRPFILITNCQKKQENSMKLVNFSVRKEFCMALRGGAFRIYHDLNIKIIYVYLH